MEVGSSPRSVSSKRRIRYKDSTWRVEHFEACAGGGEVVCRGVVVRLRDSLAVWLGGTGEPLLGELALGVPASGGAVASALVGDGGTGDGATGLARRLSAALSQPVLACCGASFDRFTAPLVERALIAQIKSKHDCS